MYIEPQYLVCSWFWLGSSRLEKQMQGLTCGLFTWEMQAEDGEGEETVEVR